MRAGGRPGAGRSPRAALPLVLPWREYLPEIAPSVFLAPGATVVGRVTIGERASIWFGAVIRGDVNAIEIGGRTNIQDGCVLHVTESTPLSLGEAVTVGHAAILHGCTIEEEALIGMGACILDGARVRNGAMVAAGSLVPPGMVVPSGVLALGSPARVARELTAREKEEVAASADQYIAYAEEYLRAGIGRVR